MFYADVDITSGTVVSEIVNAAKKLSVGMELVDSCGPSGHPVFKFSSESRDQLVIALSEILFGEGGAEEVDVEWISRDLVKEARESALA